MLRKAFQVQVEIEIQAVSCPGVWLCPNGKVSLQLYMLGSCIQTSSVTPVFPLIYQEKFIFYKSFFAVQKLNGLQKLLSKESLYVELIQWQNCEVGNVLAIFKTSLTELLFPGNRSGTMAGADIDLLMEPMKNFPGILAPKIEVSTKTVIEDKIYTSDDVCESYVINPRVVPSKNPENIQSLSRQKKVCHSSNYHRSKKCSGPCQESEIRPPFLFRRADDNLIIRKPEDMDHYCNCKKSPRMNQHKVEKCGRSKSTGRSQKSISCVKKEKLCNCNEVHSQDNCPVCSKYNYYFEGRVPSIKSKKSPRICPPKEEITTIECPCITENRDKLCNYPPKGKPSLANKIHDRLTDTLNQCSDAVSPVFENCSTEALRFCECCSVEDNCTISSIGQFYKDFYRKSREKCEKYISCN